MPILLMKILLMKIFVAAGLGTPPAHSFVFCRFVRSVWRSCDAVSCVAGGAAAAAAGGAATRATH